VPEPLQIKAVEPLRVTDRGLFIDIGSSPTEEFMEGFRRYWTAPASYSSRFDKRVFEGFEGTLIVFKKMPVEDFKNNHLGVAIDAIKSANEFAAKVYAERTAAEKAREEAKRKGAEDLAKEQAKASEIKFG
jgi:hypothetical protein